MAPECADSGAGIDPLWWTPEDWGPEIPEREPQRARPIQNALSRGSLPRRGPEGRSSAERRRELLDAKPLRAGGSPDRRHELRPRADRGEHHSRRARRSCPAAPSPAHGAGPASSRRWRFPCRSCHGGLPPGRASWRLPDTYRTAGFRAETATLKSDNVRDNLRTWPGRSRQPRCDPDRSPRAAPPCATAGQGRRAEQQWPPPRPPESRRT